LEKRRRAESSGLPEEEGVVGNDYPLPGLFPGGKAGGDYLCCLGRGKAAVFLELLEFVLLAHRQ
jgi:hypothetical protein